jgi:septum formation protein
MIRLQEGRDSDVLTAVCLVRAERREWAGAVETSVVRFKALTDPERDAYLDSGRWRGKAGAYGVQDRDPFVTVARGSFHNVVGLPLERLDALLRGHPGLTS